MYDLIIDALPNITQALTSCLIDPVPISYFIKDFSNDYFFYMGKVEKERCTHDLPTFICRDPMFISSSQVKFEQKICLSIAIYLAYIAIIIIFADFSLS